MNQVSITGAILTPLVFCLLGACANVQQFEAELADQNEAHADYSVMEVIEMELDKSRKFRIGNSLPVIATEAGPAFVLLLVIPEDALSVYFRCVFSTASAKTAHVVYPTIEFLDESRTVTSQLLPELTPQSKFNWDSAYFDATVSVPPEASYLAAIFSPEHVGKELAYEAFIPLMPVLGLYEIDRGIPVGPGDPFRIEFKSAADSE